MKIPDTASTISLMDVSFLSTTIYFLHLLKRQRLSTFYSLSIKIKKTISNHKRITNPHKVSTGKKTEKVLANL